ncbi:MAG: hypothetical protein HYX68_16090 [Planctomycetes bacterium]|nr:hypothetical protein [Planctomycetota bacterium]
MRAQKIALTVAAAVTGLFLMTVGAVVVWPYLSASLEEGPQVANNFEQQLFAPMVDMQMPQEKRIAKSELPALRGATVPVKEFTLSAPQTHGNLTIFLIHGRDTVKDARILTLQEALEQNVATVHETGGGVLLIDNRGNLPLLIQAGDIVKGGTQDRTLPFDMLIPAKTERMSIPALCVEQGRSFPRAGDLSTSFETATQQLPGRTLKLAASRKSQIEVWNNVRTLQANLARNAGGSVQAPLSQTSLQLSLEHHRVQDAVQDYLARLSPAADGKKDVIGYVVAVNGLIQSADVYASADLFQRLWPKLIRASAVSALAEKRPGNYQAPTVESVKRFLSDADRGDAFRVNTSSASHVIRQETDRQVRFDTCDSARQNVVLHRSFLVK